MNSYSSLLIKALLPAALLLSLGVAAQAGPGPVTLFFPTALQGTTGTLAFQFTPNTDGPTNTPITSSVSVTDPLGNFTLSNLNIVNEFDQTITFGTSFTFTPTFTTTATAGADEGNTFFLQVLNAAGTVQATNDPSGINSAMTIGQAADGTTAPLVVFAPFTKPPAVPEASTGTLFGLLGLGSVCLVWRGRRRKAA